MQRPALRDPAAVLEQGPRRPAWATVVALNMTLALPALAQVQQPSPTDPATASPVTARNADEVADLTEGLRLLEDVRDGTFSFDDPAFYWFCRYTLAKSDSLDAALNESPLPWKFLLERPDDYRGRVIFVEGLLQSRQGYEVTNRPGVGTLHQCELADPTTRAICTVVAVNDPGEMPFRSRVRAVGYFIKVRAFKTTTGELSAGPLIVAGTITLAQAPSHGHPAPASGRVSPGTGYGSRASGNPSDSAQDQSLDDHPLLDGSPTRRYSWPIWATVVLALAWLALRRRARPTSPRCTLPGRRFTSRRQTDDQSNSSMKDFDWLTQDEDRSD